jgi:hypothetical protein
VPWDVQHPVPGKAGTRAEVMPPQSLRTGLGRRARPAQDASYPRPLYCAHLGITSAARTVTGEASVTDEARGNRFRVVT